MTSSERTNDRPGNDEAAGSLVGGGLLGQIIPYLKDHPPLAYGIACGLLVLSLFGFAADKPLLAVLMVVVLLAGLAAWMVDARSARATTVALQPPPPEFAPDVEIGDGFDAGDDGRVASGSVPPAGSFTPKVRIGRNATFGRGASLASSGAEDAGSEGGDRPPDTSKTD